MAEEKERLGPKRTAALAVGAGLGAIIGVLIVDRAIHYARTRS